MQTDFVFKVFLLNINVFLRKSLELFVETCRSLSINKEELEGEVIERSIENLC